MELGQVDSGTPDPQTIISHLSTSLTKFIDESKQLHQRVLDHPGLKYSVRLNSKIMSKIMQIWKDADRKANFFRLVEMVWSASNSLEMYY